jgi:hypothetical protein
MAAVVDLVVVAVRGLQAQLLVALVLPRQALFKVMAVEEMADLLPLHMLLVVAVGLATLELLQAVQAHPEQVAREQETA